MNSDEKSLAMSEQMPIADLTKLKKHDIGFVRSFEEKNRLRVDRLLRVRRRNKITGALFGCSVFGIYFYSMYAVKQENFLDDFEEPLKVVEEQ